MQANRWYFATFIALSTAILSGCGSASLDVTPQQFSECSGAMRVAHVEWDASQADTKTAAVSVYGAGYPEKLFVVGAPVGHADTGKWTGDGLTFVLRDDDGHRLATRTVTTAPCAH